MGGFITTVKSYVARTRAFISRLATLYLGHVVSSSAFVVTVKRDTTRKKRIVVVVRFFEHRQATAMTLGNPKFCCNDSSFRFLPSAPFPLRWPRPRTLQYCASSRLHDTDCERRERKTLNIEWLYEYLMIGSRLCWKNFLLGTQARSVFTKSLS